MTFPDAVPTLSDGDVTLRAHRLEDVDAIVEQCTDPVSIRWTTVPLGYTADMARSFVTDSIPRGWDDDREWTFAIETTHPDGERRFSGSISLRDEGSRRAEIAFGAHPAVRGRGVMTTAVRLLLDWGFDERDLETVLWLACRGNVGSRRIAWRAGFTFGDVMPKWLNHRGEYPDAWVATLHRDDPRTPATTWYDAPVLAGNTVVLRPLREEDADRIVEGCNDPTTSHWLSFLPAPFTREDAASYLLRTVEAASRGEVVQWAMADPAGDRLVGTIGLPRIQRGSAEVGYWTHPDVRGRGLATEAVRLVSDHAFSSADSGGLGLRRLFVKVAADNVASQRVALSNGFTRYGEERSSEVLRDGSVTDMVLLDRLRGEGRG
jgi:RimJ/RimL family protein N-acetyltransferase